MPPMRQRANEKAKDSRKAFHRLVQYVHQYLPIFIFSFVLGAVGAVLIVIGPKFLEKISNLLYDAIKQFSSTHIWVDVDIKKVASLAIQLMTIYVVSALIAFITNIILARVTLKISKRMRSDLERKINKVPLSYFSKTTYGDVLSRITNDVDTITDALNNSIGSLITAICQFIACIIMMFSTDVSMAVTAIISSVLGFFIMFAIVAKSQKYFAMRQKALGALNGYIEEMYSGHSVVRAYNANSEVKERFVSLNSEMKHANFKSQFISGMMPSLMTFIGNLGYVAVCVVGALEVKNGTIEFGVISAFIVYVRLFTQPLSTISQGFTQIQSCMAASERVFDFLEEKELENEEDKDGVLDNVKGNVTFSHVRFAYDDAPDHIVIQDFSCQIKAGQKVAIVGPTGAGKTTLVNLLMRFYEPISGEILIDNKKTSDYTREMIHSLFGMVLQETWLFEGTVKENLVFNRTDVSDETIKKACKACGIHSFIKSLPQGYDTILNEDTSLSAGQKQLFTIARAMIQNSPMLILDEATSNVDTRTEILIQNAMDQLTSSRTSFVIAHRLSTIRNADLILVMKDGDIIEQGNHDELMMKNGFYATLYNSQFDEENDGSIDSMIAQQKLKEAK